LTEWPAARINDLFGAYSADEDPVMIKSVRLILACAILVVYAGISTSDAQGTSASSQWTITSIKMCRSRSGSLLPNIQVYGLFPVYSFFIPRPVWTLNGTVVDAQPVYEGGRLVSFTLLDGALYLKPGQRNIVKFTLPDQNGAKAFLFDESRPLWGECYDFF
jgi:hypothetical protein